MVSIQKADRSSSPPRRDGDADPARLLSRSCGLVSRTGSAAHHAHRQTQAHTHTSCEPILGGAALRAAARGLQKATRSTAKRVQLYSVALPRTFIGHGGRGEQGEENAHADPHDKDTPQHHAWRCSIASPVLRVVASYPAPAVTFSVDVTSLSSREFD